MMSRFRSVQRAGARAAPGTGAALALFHQYGPKASAAPVAVDPDRQRPPSDLRQHEGGSNTVMLWVLPEDGDMSRRAATRIVHAFNEL